MRQTLQFSGCPRVDVWIQSPRSNSTPKRERDMRLTRVLVVSLAILGLSTAGFAGDLHDSISRAAQQPAQTQPTKIDKAYLWPGAALFVAGMSMVVYGFLHTSGGDFVSGEVSKESKTELGGAGLAVAGLGGAILYIGAQHSKRAPSIAVGPGRISLTKRVSW
jgi:hypothetical protein